MSSTTQTDRLKPSSHRLRLLTSSRPRTSYLDQKAQIFAASIPATCSICTRVPEKWQSHDLSGVQWCDGHVRSRAAAASGTGERSGQDKDVRDEGRSSDEHVGFDRGVRCFEVGEDLTKEARKATRFTNSRSMCDRECQVRNHGYARSLFFWAHTCIRDLESRDGTVRKYIVEHRKATQRNASNQDTHTSHIALQ